MVTLVDLDPQLNDAHIEPDEDFRLLSLRDEEHAKHIGTSLKPIDDKLVSQILIDNADLFSWIASYMPGVSSDVITYRLSIYKEARLIA